MKLTAIFALVAPIIHAAQLTYPTDIALFEFVWTNPDHGSGNATGPSDGTLMTDGDTTVGSGETLTDPVQGSGLWGSLTSDTTVGMVGTFKATTLNLNTGFAYWSINTAEVVFDSGSCFGDDTTVSAYYYDFTTGTRGILTVTTTSDANNIWTFSADIATAIKTNGYIEFDITSNVACEGDIAILEFNVDGEQIATAEPTRAPTKTPTTTPTTATPTMAPTAQCKGQITWGDPHYQLMAHSSSNAPAQLNFQGHGWFYYIMPCDLNEYEEWPFFLLSHHTECWWQGNLKGCINNNRLVLNTKPDPWVIEFTNSNVDITVGTDSAGQTATDFDTANFRNYRSWNPIVIDYNDGDAQYGQVKIYYENGNTVISLHDLSYTGCDGEVTRIENQNSVTAFTCPHCFRNIGCGLMGKYTRGDCTKWDVANPNHECYNILLGSDGNTYTPPNNDWSFYNFAITWAQDTVDDTLENTYGFTVPDYLKTHEKSVGIKPLSEGRNLEIEDASYYDGNCQDNMDEIKAVNETCRENIVVKYAECCAEIGICDTLWKGCIEDMCSCTDPDSNNDFTEQDCLDAIVHDAMNVTCNLDWLYPTATPTGAPTVSPTAASEKVDLPFGESTEEFVMYMAIFVVVFVLIAIGAFWYYRKKTAKGVHSFEDTEENTEMASKSTSGGYNKTETHAAV